MVDSTNSNGTVRTALHKAVHEGLVNQVETFIEGYEINTKDVKGQTLLHHACFGGSRDVCRFLLNRGADINIQDNVGKSPLHVAYIKNNSHLFEDLLKNRINVNSQDKDGVTVLFMACSDLCEIILHRDPAREQNDRVFQELVDYNDDAKTLEIVKLLICHGADVNIPTESQNTALKNAFSAIIELEIGTIKHGFCLYFSKRTFYAFKNKWLLDDTKKLILFDLRLKFSELLYELVKAGADCNVIYQYHSSKSYKCTLLHVACMLGLESVIHILLDGGANACVPDDSGRNCLHHLLSNWVEFNLLNNGKIIIKKLLDSGVDINLRNSRGCTFLNYLISYLISNCCDNEVVQIEIIPELIDLGADVCAPDNDGNTPLHRSRYWGTSEILLNHGADINAKCKYGLTPIFNVVKLQSNCRHFEEFVNRNALVGVITQTGQSLLHSVRSWSVGAKLVERGLDINLIDNSGYTPLFQAAISCRLCVIEGLILSGADVNIQNNEGQTVLHKIVSISFFTDKYDRMLLDHGALASIKDKYGHTPVDIALSRQIYNKLLKHLMWMVNGKIHPYMTIPTVPDEQVELYRSKCEQECEKLRATKYGPISLFTVLEHHRVPVYVENKSLKEAIKKPLFKQDFPLYAAYLEKKLTEDEEKYHLLDSSKAIFTSMRQNVQTTNPCQWFSLPEEMKLHILSYLNNRELKFLVESMLTENPGNPINVESLPS